MGCFTQLFYPNNNKIIYDKINDYKYSYKSCRNIINRYVDIYLNFNYHKLQTINLEVLFEEIYIIMLPRYKVIDKHSVNRLILISIVNNIDPHFSNTNIYKKSFFLLNNNIKYDNIK
jgi:hypothetical protein